MCIYARAGGVTLKSLQVLICGDVSMCVGDGHELGAAFVTLRWASRQLMGLTVMSVDAAIQ